MKLLIIGRLHVLWTRTTIEGTNLQLVVLEEALILVQDILQRQKVCVQPQFKPVPRVNVLVDSSAAAPLLQ